MDDLSIQGLSYVKYPVDKMPSKKLNFEEASAIRIARNLTQKRRSSDLKVRYFFKTPRELKCCIKIYSWLSRYSTTRAPDPWYKRDGPTKVGAHKSILFTESVLVVKIKKTFLLVSCIEVFL